MDLQYYEVFEEWCNEQNIKYTVNNKIFYINDNNSVKPDYLLNGVVYIKIVDSIPKITKYRKLFENFKRKHGSILVIASDVIFDIRYNLTIKDLEENFKISIQ